VGVRVDVLLETFGLTWPEVRDGAVAAEQAGLDGVWVNDHLAGIVTGAPYVLECWTILSALAATVPRVALGPLVLNVANRDPGTLAVMAATLQHLSAGRLLVALGAGAGPGTPFALEQEMLGRQIPAASERRGAVAETISTLRQIWSGTQSPEAGFLRPDPFPPLVIAGLGPKMADLAGRLGDGICLPLGSKTAELVGVARRARERAGRDPGDLLVLVSLAALPDQGPPASVRMDIDRLIVYVEPPFERGVARVRDRMRQWNVEVGPPE
jgi:alkanesulfonate monooxygenase SsuD/methylene tetrahydromethanopterin reductase-like flavin-dependent oxidoreductase (luciferase family)